MEAQNRIRRNRRTGLVLGVLLGLTLAFIWGNSLQSGAASGAMSGSLRAWLEQLLHVPVDEFLLRKAAHFSEYALLGAELSLLLNLLLARNGRPPARGRRRRHHLRVARHVHEGRAYDRTVPVGLEHGLGGLGQCQSAVAVWVR